MEIIDVQEKPDGAFVFVVRATEEELHWAAEKKGKPFDVSIFFQHPGDVLLKAEVARPTRIPT